MSVEIEVDGPIFNELQRNAAIAAFVLDCKQVVAEQGRADVQTILNARIKNPTPYYETQIGTERVGDVWKVTDSDVVYGPWLEGLSERNRQTRFKGYRAFGLAGEALQEKVPTLVQFALQRAIARLGG